MRASSLSNPEIIDLLNHYFIPVHADGVYYQANKNVPAEEKAAFEKFRPIIIVEKVKTSQQEITAVLASYGYEWFTLGLNLLAVHPSDPTRQAINVAQPGTAA